MPVMNASFKSPSAVPCRPGTSFASSTSFTSTLPSFGAQTTGKNKTFNSGSLFINPSTCRTPFSAANTINSEASLGCFKSNQEIDNLRHDYQKNSMMMPCSMETHFSQAHLLPMRCPAPDHRNLVSLAENSIEKCGVSTTPAMVTVPTSSLDNIEYNPTFRSNSLFITTSDALNRDGLPLRSSLKVNSPVKSALKSHISAVSFDVNVEESYNFYDGKQKSEKDHVL